jgi:hypothetical protein
VVAAVPVRQACRAATLGDKSGISRLAVSVLARLVISDFSSVLFDIYSRIRL